MTTPVEHAKKALRELMAENQRLAARVEKLEREESIQRQGRKEALIALREARARAEELEAALREIDSLPNQSEHWHDNDVPVRIARAELDKDTPGPPPPPLLNKPPGRMH